MKKETLDLIAEAEAVLLSLCTREINEFARKHRKETFYGFALDCNLDYAQVLLCFNSEQCLARSAGHPSEVEVSNRKAFAKIMEKLHRDMNLGPYEQREDSPEERRKDFRWNPGDWGYQGTDRQGGHLLEAAWDRVWGPFQEKLHSQIIDDHLWDKPDQRTDETRTAFLEMLYRVLFALEAADAFASIRKTTDFATLILDHDESEEDAWQRMHEMRRRYASTAASGEPPPETKE